MFSSVTSWLGGSKPEEQNDKPAEASDKENEAPESVEGEQTKKNTEVTDQAAVTEASEKQPESDNDFHFPQVPNIDLGDVGEKTFSAAKEWGGYLFNVGKAATQQVVKTAKQVKDTVEEKTILGDFTKEQEKFVEQKEQHRVSDAAVAPWVGYNEEEAMKTQILALSEDQRNFLRNPPSGVQFQYDAAVSHPVAMAMLQEDPKLSEMRFKLVPKQIKEEPFWRNYFYRVSLIKQSAQLTTLAQQSGDESDSSNERRKSTESHSDKKVHQKEEEKELVRPSSSPPENEFISDAFNENFNHDDVRAEMQKLGFAESKESEENLEEDIPEWEKELDAELQEYEVVDDAANGDEDADLENEILQQIEAEAGNSK